MSFLDLSPFPGTAVAEAGLAGAGLVDDLAVAVADLPDVVGLAGVDDEAGVSRSGSASSCVRMGGVELTESSRVGESRTEAKSESVSSSEDCSSRSNCKKT